MEILLLFEKSFWFGTAALGFAFLFNVPQRVLLFIWLFGFGGGFVKLLTVEMGVNVVLATLFGAIFIGIMAIPAAHTRHAPPLVFTIPSVIPMVPGVYAYNMMLGIIKLAGNANNPEYFQILSETVSNGLNMFFILLAISAGASFPLLIMRKESVKDVKLFKRKLK